MFTSKTTNYSFGRAAMAAAWLLLSAGCTGSQPPLRTPLQSAQAMSGRQATRTSSLPNHAGRCAAFTLNFDEFVACRRADGTLQSFLDARIDWRVRYFVRYWQMPCGDMPTVEEAYVFHMVTRDLYRDRGLSDGERLEIRAAMFHGNERCG
jgi:hypothetical protein